MYLHQRKRMCALSMLPKVTDGACNTEKHLKLCVLHNLRQNPLDEDHSRRLHLQVDYIATCENDKTM